MTKAAHDDGCELAWEPGGGPLWAIVLPHALPPLDLSRLPGDARAIPRDRLHVTLLRRAAMSPLAASPGVDWPSVCAALPRPPAVSFRPGLFRARRPPDPEKDAPGDPRPRTTWFLALAHQAAWHEARRRIVATLHAASVAHGGPGLALPSDPRLFHVSLFNDRGGDPRRSIGDIGPEDLEDWP